MTTESRIAAIRTVANNAILRNALTETASVIDDVVLLANQQVELHITHDRHQFVPDLAIANENQKPLYQERFRKRKIQQARLDAAGVFQDTEQAMEVYQSEADTLAEVEISDFAFATRVAQFGMDDPTLQIDPPVGEDTAYKVTPGARSPLFFGTGLANLAPVPNDVLLAKLVGGRYTESVGNFEFNTAPVKIGNAAIKESFSMLQWPALEGTFDLIIPDDGEQLVDIAIAINCTGETAPTALDDPSTARSFVTIKRSPQEGEGFVEILSFNRSTGGEVDDGGTLAPVEVGKGLRFQIVAGPQDYTLSVRVSADGSFTDLSGTTSLGTIVADNQLAAPHTISLYVKGALQQGIMIAASLVDAG